jgi:outer membrane autotransporter protein
LLIDFTSVLNVTGDYTQGSGATLEFQLGGVGLSGQLNVTGNAALDGTLTLTPVNGYTPATGDAFQILTFGSRNGTDFANPPPGFDLNYDDVGGSLSVVAQ